MMFRQFPPNLSLLIKMKGRKYALNMNARGVSWHPPAFLLLSLSFSLSVVSEHNKISFLLPSFHNVYGCFR